MIVPAPQTNPSWNLVSTTKLSISVSECGQVPGRHREMGTALDHRAGQSAHTTHSWSIYHGPLVWSCFAGSTTLPFIHSAALRAFDHTNVQGTLLSSLGSSSTNSLGLCRLVMTTDQARHTGLIVLIRWGILGNVMLRLIDLFCVRYQSWHRPHIATLGTSGWWNSYELPGYCLLIGKTDETIPYKIKNEDDEWWRWGRSHYDDDINKGAPSRPEVHQ